MPRIPPPLLRLWPTVWFVATAQQIRARSCARRGSRYP